MAQTPSPKQRSSLPLIRSEISTKTLSRKPRQRLLSPCSAICTLERATAMSKSEYAQRICPLSDHLHRLRLLARVSSQIPPVHRGSCICDQAVFLGFCARPPFDPCLAKGRPLRDFPGFLGHSR